MPFIDGHIGLPFSPEFVRAWVSMIHVAGGFILFLVVIRLSEMFGGFLGDIAHPGTTVFEVQHRGAKAGTRSGRD